MEFLKEYLPENFKIKIKKKPYRLRIRRPNDYKIIILEFERKKKKILQYLRIEDFLVRRSPKVFLFIIQKEDLKCDSYKENLALFISQESLPEKVNVFMLQLK